MKKVLVITGITASGKTSLAVKIAKRIKADLISADSRQIYKEMDIGTGKDIGKSGFKSVMKIGRLDIGYHVICGIRIWLLDVVEPNFKFSVTEYRKAFDRACTLIEKRNRKVIVVGGSGFYVESILNPSENFNKTPKK